MFGQAELNRLQQRKQLLVLQSQADRLTLTAEVQQLWSMEFWQKGIGQIASRHPLLSAALAAAAGFVAFKAVRRPGMLLSMLGGLGGAGSTLLSLWKLFRPK